MAKYTDGTTIPVDLVTISGSGLDPHISVAVVNYQMPRLVKATGKRKQKLKTLLKNIQTINSLDTLWKHSKCFRNKLSIRWDFKMIVKWLSFFHLNTIFI